MTTEGLAKGPTPLFHYKTEVTVLPEAANAHYLGTCVDDLGTPPLGTSGKCRCPV